ncbi:sulfatase-like hydrolase/transferase [candidate division KSB1 bacterium]|nr:sulfatase-like hydrolase/transferase [candidate division KSB1 bacterium]
MEIIIMNRNVYLLVSMLFCFALTCLGSQDLRGPNILFFYGDDWGKIAGCYKDDHYFGGISSVAKTPAFDRLAKEGVRFDNAFFPVPQCTPCRASIATGSYFWRTGKTAFLNQKDGFKGYDAGTELPGFGPVLIRQGYYIGSSGKTMNKRWIKSRPIKGVVDRRYSLAIYKGKDEAERQKIRKNLEAGYRQVIQNLLAKSKDKPFYFVFGPINTHRPWIRGSGKNLWGLDPDSLKGKMPAFLPDVPEVREDMADYLGEIMALDLMLTCFMEELDRAGQLDNTVIIATGDNGPPGFTRGKTNMYDFGSAAPLLVRWPGVVLPGRVVDDFVNLMDLGPTFIDIAGGDIPESMDGRSILPVLQSKDNGQIDPARDHVIFGRERHVHNARQGNLSYPSRAIRNKDFLYIQNYFPDRWPLGDPLGSANEVDQRVLAKKGSETYTAFRDMDGSPTKSWIMSIRDDTQYRKYWDWTFAKRPAEELYEINKDPLQLNNLAGNSKYKEIKDGLRQKLQNVRSQTGDPRLTDVFEKPPFVNKGN